MGIFDKKKKDVRMMMAEERNYILGKSTPFSVREAYNALRSNITFSALGGGCNVIAVSSTLQAEGKSINALNMAASYADIGKKVLLIDCDLRKPKLHKLLNIKASPGFSNVLVGDCSIEDAVQHNEVLNLDILCSGDIPPVSTRLLESDSLKETLDKFREKYDYVFIDTPPVNIVIDGCVLAKHTDGFIFVVKQGYALREKIVSSVKQIEFAGGKILGFVLNDVIDKNIMSLNKYRYKYRYKYGRGKYYYHGQYSDDKSGRKSNKKTKSATGDSVKVDDKAEEKAKA